MALIKCPECGRDVSDQAGACPQCGYPLESASPATPPPAQETPAIEPPPEPMVEEQKKPKRGKGAVLAVLIIIAIIAAAIFLPNSSSKTQLIKNGAYTFTPQEYIDSVNEYLDYMYQENGDITYRLPDFDPNDESQDISDKHASLDEMIWYEISTNKDGFIIKIEFGWFDNRGSEKKINSIVAYFNTICGFFAPESFDALNNLFSSVTTISGEFPYDANGSRFTFYNGGGFRYFFSVEPIPAE